MKCISILAMTVVLSVSSSVHAQSSPSSGNIMSGMPVPECMDPKNRHTPLCKDMEEDMQEKRVIHHAFGVVKAIDPVKGTVTFAHGPVASLHWPAMTMRFAVKDKTLFDKLAIGRKIEFEFRQQGADYIVTTVK